MTYNKQVYIIDDDAKVRSLIRGTLDQSGYQCVEYRSAESFLQKHETEPSGCMIVDIELEGMSGLELQNVLVKKGWRIPRIFVSGIAHFDNAVEALQNGAFMMLKKPFAKDQLEQLVFQAFIEIRRRKIEVEKFLIIKERVLALTQTERSVLEHVLEGKSNKAIAYSLDIGLRSVVRIRRKLFDHFGVESVPILLRELFDAAFSPLEDNRNLVQHILKLFDDEK